MRMRSVNIGVLRHVRRSDNGLGRNEVDRRAVRRTVHKPRVRQDTPQQQKNQDRQKHIHQSQRRQN